MRAGEPAVEIRPNVVLTKHTLPVLQRSENRNQPDSRKRSSYVPRFAKVYIAMAQMNESHTSFIDWPDGFKLGILAELDLELRIDLVEFVPKVLFNQADVLRLEPVANRNAPATKIEAITSFRAHGKADHVGTHTQGSNDRRLASVVRVRRA